MKPRGTWARTPRRRDGAITAYVGAVAKKELEARAIAERRSLSDLVRLALEWWLGRSTGK